MLWAVVDAQLIDGLVNWCGQAAQGLARGYGRFFQTGRVQAYALGVAVGTFLIVFVYSIG